MAPSGEEDLTFHDLPPFPTDVPTAPLLSLSLQKLLDYDPTEIDRLWKACTELGFFYLDLRNAHGAAPAQFKAHDSNGANGHSNGVNGHTNGATNGANGHAHKDTIDGEEFLQAASDLFGVADQFFDLPVEEKVKYDFKDEGSYFGYKGYGAGIVDAKGNKDRNEFYNIAKDDIIGLSDPIKAPPETNPWRPTLKTYITNAHAIVTLLLTHLNTLLALPASDPSSTLPLLHRLLAPSGDQVRLVKAPPQPAQDRRAALGAHTDFGSVTLLFNRLGGLQILPPDASIEDRENGSAWLYVKPLRGHCIVNLGDAMVKLTRGVLRSNMHRVVNPPGEQGDSVRFSLVYFNRPEDSVMLTPLKGSEVIGVQTKEEAENEEVISAKEWTLRRALGRRGVGSWDKSEGTEAAGRRRGGMRDVEVK